MQWPESAQPARVWPGAKPGQPSRAWAAASSCRPSPGQCAPSATPAPAADALAAAALTSGCSSSSSSSGDRIRSATGSPATAGGPPHEWVVWTHLPAPASNTQARGPERVALRARGRAWAAVAVAAASPCAPSASAPLAVPSGAAAAAVAGRSLLADGGCSGGGSSSSSHSNRAGERGVGAGGRCYSQWHGSGGLGAAGLFGGGGGGGGGRAMLLASLTTSSASSASPSASAPSASLPSSSAAAVSAVSTPAATAPPSGTPAAAGTGTAGQGPGPGSDAAGAVLFRGFNLPQISLMPAGRLPGTTATAAYCPSPATAAFAADQELAAELYDYHVAKHGGFPRPCPGCKSHSFFERVPPGAAASASTAAPSAAAAASGGSGGGEEVVAWRSRPLCCDMCGAWVHLGCARVDLLERVPPRPWFHSPVCRNNYIRLEAAAEQNPHASSDSPSSQLYILTPADQAAYAAMAARAAVSSSGSSGSGRGGGMQGRPRGPAGSVVPLLEEGFNADAIQGFGEPGREYDGGRYAAVLVAERQPVAAATFNVWGRDAQLCMLATAAAARRRGHGAALVADLEGQLRRLGVQRMLVQARRVALPMWLGPRFGYSLVAPEAAEELHAQLPVAYYDCALLEKWL
ncbi:hypothetical protein HYH02_009627 [Chlamydomonas schloesseri]|uniref:N-acetyltransferase domain-containing protein n=1 Tax=Chlamydomonas schloesseri TaxID=2026947 RepID=A0A835W8Y1_9CHLO|nr:hypothetical protein HYH02_009627 [Chlamydomonas schloesseri]|eukprot:KAG2442139.1 hypothetical protein HYH02_009627 [Chlamydomonas schloesseri]